MTATTVDRNTPCTHVERMQRYALTTATTIPAGAMVSTNAAGTAVNAADTAAHVCQGRAAHRASNVAPDTDTEIVVEKGLFWWANDGTITAASIGLNATILDNQTVSLAATTTNDIVAGRIEAVDATLGVLVNQTA